MRVVITGANGFIGKNLPLRLARLAERCPSSASRVTTSQRSCRRCSRTPTVVFHLAGVNRPTGSRRSSPRGNADSPRRCARALAAVAASHGRTPVRHIRFVHPGRARQSLRAQQARRRGRCCCRPRADAGVPVRIFRLPNVFGKWCRPNYNSAVATFCHNIARGLPIEVHDADAPLSLVYVDDVVDAFLRVLRRRRRH